jgi:hypothetical protein
VANPGNFLLRLQIDKLSREEDQCISYIVAYKYASISPIQGHQSYELTSRNRRWEIRGPECVKRGSSWKKLSIQRCVAFALLVGFEGLVHSMLGNLRSWRHDIGSIKI